LGRYFGKVIMGYEKSVRMDAKQYFLLGHTQKEVKDHFNVGSNSTVVKWAREDHWLEDRQRFSDEAVRAEIGKHVQEILKENEDAVAGLKRFEDIALDSIMEEDGLRPTKFVDAAQVFNQSITLKKQYSSEILQLKFVLAVANILREEIDDPEILTRIGRRLGLLVGADQTERRALADSSA
jgi:hypothetical protein